MYHEDPLKVTEDNITGEKIKRGKDKLEIHVDI